MTISSTTNRRAYTGNGVTRAFSFPYFLIAKADLKVYLAGVLKTLETHYTITGNPTAGPWPDGVTVTFPAPADPPANGASIVIIRDPSITQGTDLTENDSLPVETVERTLDRGIMIAQRLAARVGRSLRQPDPDVADIAEIPAKADRASKYAAYDVDGDPVATSGTTSAYVVSTYMETVLDDADAATARGTLGASTVGDAVFTAADAAAARTTLETYSSAEVDALLAALLPAGSMIDFGGGAVPDGYLGCDGSNVSRTTYATLFAATGTTWGAGDGATTFALPDSRRRVAVGSGGSGTSTLANSVGSTGGEETHTLQTSEIPASLTVSDSGHVHNQRAQTSADVVGSTELTMDDGGGSPVNTIYPDAAAGNSTQKLTTSSATTGIAVGGGGGAHNVMQPSYVVTKIIKV